MDELEQFSTVLGENRVTVEQLGVTNAAVIPIENEDDDIPTVTESEPATVTGGAAETAANGSDKRLNNAAETAAAVKTAVSATPAPEFDRVQAITRFLVGGVLEGTDEFAKRLELWEAYLRELLPDASPDLSEASARELLRYGLVGFIFESEDSGRILLQKLWKVPGGMAKTAVRPSKSLANSRFTRPLRRRLDRMADRGEKQIMRWIERGHREEPLSRNLARLGIQEITDEFINQLAQNEEVKELVQEQSMGLAGEAVDQVRERTFSADTLVERIARALTRRPPRLEPPLADLSDYHGGKRVFEEDDTE